MVLEDSADFELDAGDVEEALTHYEKCLMLVQEDGDIHREAEVDLNFSYRYADIQ